jgi:beta-lactamase regulating signal transducer with metallopeptidase domain
MSGLVTWLWQGVVLVAASAGIVRVLPRLNAATRYAIWWLTLGLVLVHPWAPAALSILPSGPVAGEAAGLLPVPRVPAPPLWLPVLGLAVWLSCALWRVWQIAVSLRAIAVLKREATPCDDALARRLPLWAAASASGRRCTLGISDRADGPCALGFRRPMIVVPRRIAERLSDADLDQVIAHEHAHLQRRDDWLQLLQCSIGALCGLHPAVWLLGRRLDLEREAACDDRVVARTGCARRYARCLARVAALRLAGRPAIGTMVPAAVRSSQLLRTRVERLLSGRWSRTPRVGRWSTAVSALALGLIMVACDQAPPLVTFAERTLDLPVVVSASASPEGAEPASRPAPVRFAPTAVPTAVTSPAPAEPAPHVPSEAPPKPAIGESRLPGRLEAHPITGALDLQSITLSATPPPEPCEPADSAVAGPQKGWLPVSREPARVSWSAIGPTVVQAGVTVGKGAGRVGQSVGRWFAQGPWSGTRDSTH